MESIPRKLTEKHQIQSLVSNEKEESSHSIFGSMEKILIEEVQEEVQLSSKSKLLELLQEMESCK